MNVDKNAFAVKRVLHTLAPWLVLVFFSGAVWLLYRELKHYHYRDIVQSLQQIPSCRVWTALGLTVVNYLILVGYDWLAIRSIGYPLSIAKTAFASFVGHVTSYNFGGLLGGSSVRYRLYSAWGLSSVEIVRLLTLLFFTFWIGTFFLAGVFFTLDPIPIPPRLHLMWASVRPFGAVFLVLVVAYVSTCAVYKRPTIWFGWELSLPSLRIAICQIGVASADLLVAAGVLYVLLPTSSAISYPHFLTVYLLAVVAVLFTHVPGGLGVFELVILLLTPADPALVVGALLFYRVVYYLLPLLIAAIMLGANEMWMKKAEVREFWRLAEQFSARVTPWLLSFLTFLAGALLLFSGALPAAHDRMGWIRHLVPLPVIEISHFFGSIAGVGLLLLARSLHRRLDSAYWLAVTLLAFGAVFSMLKGWNVEEAVILTTMLGILLSARRGFHRKGSLFGQPFGTRWVVAVLLVLGCSLWLGLFSYKHVEYSNELWWHFSLRGDAPRFLRATVGAAMLLLLVAGSRLLRPAIPKPGLPSAAELATAAKIVAASPATYANLALLGDKRLLFDESRSALIMYGVIGQDWVAMGDPVGPVDLQAQLVWRFRELCDQYHARMVFYQVGEETLPLYLDMGLTLLKLGEEARVPLGEFSLEGNRRKSLRHAVNRVKREGCVVEVISPGDVPRRILELKNVSDDWLAGRKTAEKSFSLGRFQPDYLARYPVFVVRQESRIVAFANTWLGAGKEELSVDLMRHVREAPSGVMEYLFVETMLWGKQQGYQWFNLGMAPLSGLESRSLAPVWNRLGHLVFRHGEHFYHFQGLRQYKEKFAPTWRPRYLASPGGFALPQILADIATLISGGMWEMVTK